MQVFLLDSRRAAAKSDSHFCVLLQFRTTGPDMGALDGGPSSTQVRTLICGAVQACYCDSCESACIFRLLYADAVVHCWQLSLAACAYESICFDFPLPRHDELTALVDLLRCGRTSDLLRFPFSSRFISGYACATATQSAARALLWAPGIVYLTNRISDVPAKQEGLEPEHGPEQPVPSDELVTSLFALVFVKGFGQLLSACSAVQHCTPTQLCVACRRRRSGCAARWPFAFEATRTGRYGLQWERTSSSSTCSPTIASRARPRFRSSTQMRSRCGTALCGCCKPRSYR